MKKPAYFFLLLILCFAISTLPMVSAAEDSWVTKESMQQARSGLGVAVVNDKIYAIGGIPSNGFQPSSPGSAVYAGKTSVAVTGKNEEYNPETDTWIFKTSMPTPRAVFAIAVYQNKIYCIGGKTTDNYTGVNEVYDPATDTWETKTSMPTARAFLQANVVNDKIYLIGGHGLPDDFLLINEVYDPLTDTWSTSEPMLSTTFFGYASVVFDNKIYTVGMQIMGGFSEAKTQIFDTETSGWSYGTSPPSIGTAAGATTGVLAPKRMYVIGSSNVEVYDHVADSWSLGANVITSNRYNFGVAVVNDLLYVIGGHTYVWITGNYTTLAVNEQYTPIGYIPEFPSWITLPLLLVATLVVTIARNKLVKKGLE